jgi:heme-degrading monooxygenase HmoA
MFARWILCSMRRGARSSVERVADRIAPLYRGREGFKGLMVLMGEITGEYAILTLWERREDAEAAGAVPFPHGYEEFAALLQGPPTVRILEVYEPVS